MRLERDTKSLSIDTNTSGNISNSQYRVETLC
jgi:hypothetical protein